MLQRIKADWQSPVIVAATGPGLTADVVWQCRKARWFGPYRIVAVSDAWRLLPLADALYSCDAQWWDVHQGAPGFAGEKWSSHNDHKDSADNKLDAAERHGLRLVRGKLAAGFSTDPEAIHYGHNSGFQAVNFAILRGATKIVLVGFDMREVDGRKHFFGDHPQGMRNPERFNNFINAFRAACPPPVPIVNATPGSALDCFPMVDLGETLERDCRHWDRAESDPRPDTGGTEQGIPAVCMQ